MRQLAEMCHTISRAFTASKGKLLQIVIKNRGKGSLNPLEPHDNLIFNNVNRMPADAEPFSSEWWRLAQCPVSIMETQHDIPQEDFKNDVDRDQYIPDALVQDFNRGLQLKVENKTFQKLPPVKDKTEIQEHLDNLYQLMQRVPEKYRDKATVEKLRQFRRRAHLGKLLLQKSGSDDRTTQQLLNVHIGRIYEQEVSKTILNFIEQQLDRYKIQTNVERKNFLTNIRNEETSDTLELQDRYLGRIFVNSPDRVTKPLQKAIEKIQQYCGKENLKNVLSMIHQGFPAVGLMPLQIYLNGPNMDRVQVKETGQFAISIQKDIYGSISISTEMTFGVRRTGENKDRGECTLSLTYDLKEKKLTTKISPVKPL